MGYTNLFFMLKFDGTDETLPNLGEDVWVKMRNPRLMPPSMLKAEVTFEMDPETGMPVNPADIPAAEREAQKMTAKLIADWNVFDATVAVDDPPLLPLPTINDPSPLDKIPMDIVSAIQARFTESFR